MYKVHTPALGRTGRYGRGATMQGDVLPSPHTHPELQILESIESRRTRLRFTSQPSRRSNTKIH